jgi:hypothetical protein
VQQKHTFLCEVIESVAKTHFFMRSNRKCSKNLPLEKVEPKPTFRKGTSANEVEQIEPKHTFWKKV